MAEMRIVGDTDSGSLAGPGPISQYLTRRECCGGLLVTLGTLAAGGCATVAGVSPEREQQAGREEAEEVERTTGLVKDPALVGYVRQVGERLVSAASATNVTWQFQVSDEPDPNAFALPGGWVYVTRGLLELVNREDELAGVVGHEVAHVVERHAAQRVSAATPFAVLFGAPAAILGRVSPALGGVLGGAGKLATGLVVAPYSREQEHEADRVGATLTAKSGWDPRALSTFLQTLEREDALDHAGERRSSFFSMHPATPERVKEIEALAGSLARANTPPIVGNREALLARLDGLLVGDNPAYGVFLDSLFVHPGADLAMQMPASWKTRATAEAAGAIAGDGGAVVLFQRRADGDDPVAGARSDGLSDRQVGRLERVRIGGLPAARLLAQTQQGDLLDLTWIAHRQRIFRVAGICEISGRERYAGALQQVATSTRPLRPGDRERILETRLRIRTARSGETLAQVLTRSNSPWSPARAAVANGVAVETRLEAGWPVKVAVRQRHVPAP
jgi:predicted Zn-dependent protease